MLFRSTRPTRRVWHPTQLGEKLIFEPEHLKIRNDFVGMSRDAANATLFNWITTDGGLWTKEQKESQQPNEDQATVDALWAQHEAQTPLPLRIGLHRDKGGAILYDIKDGVHQLTWIQLRGYADMARHYSSGWAENQNFLERSRKTLEQSYAEMNSVWQHDVTD